MGEAELEQERLWRESDQSWENLPQPVLEKIAQGGPWGFRWVGEDPQTGSLFPIHGEPSIGMRGLAWACAEFECTTLPRELPSYLESRLSYRADINTEVRIDRYRWVMHTRTMEEAMALVVWVQWRAVRELNRRKAEYRDYRDYPGH